MNLAETPFELPPRRFRHHLGVLMVLAILAAALSVVIWLYVPNEGDGPLLGRLLDGLRDALLVLLWGLFAVFAAASTAALAVIPTRWLSVLRLVLAYVAGIAAVAGVVWLLAHGM